MIGYGFERDGIDTVIQQLSGTTASRCVVGMHTLAVAERTVKILERLVGTAPTWRSDRALVLFPFADPVGSIPGTDLLYGRYLGDQGAIRFDFVDRPEGPYACLSHDLIVHEVCHAYLDGTKHWFGWPSGSVETRAITESLGDLAAMISIARLKGTRELALEESDGQLESRSNTLSRFPDIPLTDVLLRDASLRSTKAEVDAEHPADSETRAYALSRVISSSLYSAMARRASDLTIDSRQLALRDAAHELGEAAFSGLPSLPDAEVSIADFVTAALTNSDSGFSSRLEEAFSRHGLV